MKMQCWHFFCVMIPMLKAFIDRMKKIIAVACSESDVLGCLAWF